MTTPEGRPGQEPTLGEGQNLNAEMQKALDDAVREKEEQDKNTRIAGIERVLDQQAAGKTKSATENFGRLMRDEPTLPDVSHEDLQNLLNEARQAIAEAPESTDANA